MVSNWDLLGAAIGLQGPATPRGWWDLVFRSAVPYYYIFLAVLALTVWITYAMARSRFGYYLRAIRAGERAAQSLGVPVRRYQARRTGAERRAYLGRGLALRLQGRLRRIPKAGSASSSRCR